MFDVEAARKAGYSDAEIADHLAQSRGFDAPAARKAGYSDSELIAHLSATTDLPSQIPGNQPVQPRQPDPSLAETAVGAGEAALSTVTGLTGGAAGMVAGTVGGLAGSLLSGEFGTREGAKRVEQAAAKGAEALTYAPRTPSGQAQAQAVGQAMQQVIPVAPVVGGIPVAARPVAQGAGNARTAALQAVRAKVQAAAERRSQSAANDPAMPTPGTMGSVGAAGTDISTVRRGMAEELPAPVQLTKGQATRDFEQVRFEGEMAKDPVRGQQLRERFADQNQAIPRNFDVWIDEVGAQKVDLPSVGDAVTSVLRQRAAADKARIRVAYKEAEKAGAMEAPVSLEGVVAYLNEAAPDAATAPLLTTVRGWAKKLGIADEAPDGALVPAGGRVGSALMNDRQAGGAVTLKTAETFRQAINRNTDFEPTNIRQATIIKGLIDEATEGLGGDKYRAARQLRRQYAERYENFGLARDLLNNKRGMSDAIVPAEKVFQRAILGAPMADVKQIGRLLKSSGDPGRQAWAELRGAALRHLRDEATKNVASDSRGNPVVSPAKLNAAVQQLDQSGKLEYLFGKKGAEQVRAVNELSKVVLTVPPGAVNTSNTASVILAALDMATSGVAGFPVPVMSGLRILTTHVKDRQIQKRINEALGIKSAAKVKAPQSVVPPRALPPANRAPESRTVH